MLDFLTRLRRPAERRPGTARSTGRERRVPPGMRVYAIGDIHGRADLLDALLALIEKDDEGRPSKRKVLVFLGDYIDRGPGSREVLERLTGLSSDAAETVFLLGNHEEALLRILGGETGLVEDWLRFGGRECMTSYGVDPVELAALSPANAAGRIAEAIPQAHKDFLRSCDDSLTIGDYLFVHAGIRPGAPLSAQRQRDLRWIREPFLSCEDDHGAVIVHGHSISDDVDWQPNRIGIDTGAYATGILTALVLSGPRRRTLQAVQGEGDKAL